MGEQVRHCCLVHLQLLNQRLHCIAPPILLQYCDSRAEVDGSSGVMVSVRHYLGLVCHRDAIAAAADLHIPPSLHDGTRPQGTSAQRKLLTQVGVVAGRADRE